MEVDPYLLSHSEQQQRQLQLVQQQQDLSTYLANFILRIHASFVLPLPGPFLVIVQERGNEIRTQEYGVRHCGVVDGLIYLQGLYI